MMRIYIGEIVRGRFESRVQSRLFCYYLYTTAIDNSLHKGRMKMYNHITNQLNSYFFAVKRNAKQGRSPLQQNAIIFCFVYFFFFHSFFLFSSPLSFLFSFPTLLLDPNTRASPLFPFSFPSFLSRRSVKGSYNEKSDIKTRYNNTSFLSQIIIYNILLLDSKVCSRERSHYSG